MCDWQTCETDIETFRLYVSMTVEHCDCHVGIN